MAEKKGFTRHGAKSAEYLATLREITPDDYKRLECLCVQAIVQGHESVEIVFPYTAKFAKDWPRGVLFKKDGPRNHFKCKPDKIMKWLLKHGHTCVTMEMLRLEQIKFSRMERELFNEYE